MDRRKDGATAMEGARDDNNQSMAWNYSTLEVRSLRLRRSADVIMPLLHYSRLTSDGNNCFICMCCSIIVVLRRCSAMWIWHNTHHISTADGTTNWGRQMRSATNRNTPWPTAGTLIRLGRYGIGTRREGVEEWEPSRALVLANSHPERGANSAFP